MFVNASASTDIDDLDEMEQYIQKGESEGDHE